MFYNLFVLQDQHGPWNLVSYFLQFFVLQDQHGPWNLVSNFLQSFRITKPAMGPGI